MIAGTNTTKDGARFWGLIWTFGGSQLDHAFPETDGSEGSQTDTKASLFEFRRPPEKPPGHPRTRRRHGLSPLPRDGSTRRRPCATRKSAFLREQLGNSRCRSGRVVGCRFVFAGEK